MATVVELKYQDLVDGKDLSDLVLKAYGPGGLGALTISGIPNYVELREKLLTQGHKLAHQPDEVKKTLEHEESMYNVGWSHGKEKLRDKPDFAKGSFYANPLHDEPAESPEQLEKFPWAMPNNIWPKEAMPELEPAFKNLGKTMYDATVLLCKQIDRLVEKQVPTYKAGTLFNAISTTRKVKGRLLYYYPSEDHDEDSWIGWHNDSGFLTALTSAIFVNDKTGEVVSNPDPNGGLWIVDRDSGSVRAKIPADQLAVQCGECLQIITGGLLVATPHCVRASECKDFPIGRATFPVFIDTRPEFPLSAPEGVSREQVFGKTVNSKVPPLESRWLKDGVCFADFLGDTFKQYYEWSMK